MKDNRNQLMTLAEQRIRLLYTNAYEQAMKIAEVRKALDAATDESFTFKANPRAEKELRKILEELGLKLDNLIISGKKKLAKDGVEMAGNNILAKVAASQKPLAERLIQAAANANRSAQAIGMEIANEKHGGVKLSANVWKAVESSRKELEIIIQNNIIEGKGADVASREVRQYLRDPNRLYRRVKDKTTGEYKLSKAAQQYHPGQGRYRSSYMNARRLAVTEMNMATQAAECAAYADNPLVAGYEIRLSNNHTVKDPKHPGKVNPLHDVCDELQGKYPATFRFTGWHPHCRCTMIPILISAEERRKLAQARAEGKDYTPKGIITDVPANYKAWVAKNQDRIASAKTLPFFLQDNGEMTKDGYVIGGFAPQEPEQPTALQIAEKRHAQRTPEQEEAIRREWNERTATRKFGDRVYKYMESISDVDIKPLADALNGGDTAKILAEAQKLKAVGKQILSLDKLDNPMQVARQTSMQTAKIINDAVTRTLSKMPTRLEDRLSKLDYEIDWVAREGKKRYPDTWKYSQDAYKKERSLVERKLKVRQIKDSVSGALTYAKTTRSKKLKDLATEFDAIIGAPNIDFVKAKEISDRLADEYNRLMAAKSPKVSVLGSETLAELKQKMGNNLPKTLENLDKAISNFTRNNPDFVKNRDSIQKEMASIFQANDLGMDINGQLLESVYNNGFYNTFQSGTSDGYCGSRQTTGPIDVSHGRLRAAHKLFGLGSDLKNDQIARSEYEKYGHLLDRDKTESFLHNRTWYGASQGKDNQVQIRFKRDKVLCTWTFNDSLSCTYQPSLVTDPKIESFDNMLSTGQMPRSSDTRSLYAWQRQKGTSYVELQYHGKLTIDDVESIVFADTPSNIIKADLIDKLKAKGIELFYYDGSKVVRYF